MSWETFLQHTIAVHCPGQIQVTIYSNHFGVIMSLESHRL